MLAGAGVVEQLRSCGALDGLFERIDSGGAGDHWDRWPAPRFAQRVALERGLAAELTDHQGFWEEPGRLRRRVPTRGTGPRPRPLTSEVGPFETGGRPRCRAGSFTPRRVAQGGQCRPGRPGFDDHQLVRPGMTVRDIRHRLASTIGAASERGRDGPRKSPTRCGPGAVQRAARAGLWRRSTP